MQPYGLGGHSIFRLILAATLLCGSRAVAIAPTMDYQPLPDHSDSDCAGAVSANAAYEIDFRGPGCLPGTPCSLQVTPHPGSGSIGGGGTIYDTTVGQCSVVVLSGSNGQANVALQTGGFSYLGAQSGPTANLGVTCAPAATDTVARVCCDENRGTVHAYPFFDVFCPKLPAPGFASTPPAGSTITLSAASGQSTQANLILGNPGTLALNVDPSGIVAGSVISTSLIGHQVIPAGATSTYTVNCSPTAATTVPIVNELRLLTDGTSTDPVYTISCVVIAAPPVAAPVFSVAAAPSPIAIVSPNSGNTTLTIKNIGDASLTATPQTPAAPFGISAAGGAIAPGGSFDYTVSCDGSNAGEYDASIRFTTNDPDRPSPTVDVRCTVFPPPVPDFASMPAPRGAIAISTAQGTNASKNLVVENHGTAALQIATAAIGNESPTGVLSVAPTSATIGPGDNRAFSITCNAVASTNATATLTLTSNDADTPTALYDLLCGVTGPTPTPRLALSPNGTVAIATAIGVAGSQTLSIQNVGNANLVISALNGPTGPQISKSAVSLPMTIVPGASQPLALGCTSASSGTFNDTLTIVSNDATTPNRSVPINCSVSGPPAAPIYSSTPVNGGTLAISTGTGVTGRTTLTIRNTGNADLTLTTAIGGGSTPISTQPTAATVAPGATLALGVVCSAATAGSFNRTLNVQTNAAGAASVPYSLTCSVNGTPAAVSFQPQQLFAVNTAPRGSATADLNGDGKLDLVVANRSSDNVSVLLGYGSGSFRKKLDFACAAGGGAGAVAIADFNHDNKPDLAVANHFGSTVSVLLGNGDGSFQTQVGYATGSGPFAVAVGDFNGDGNPDLAAANFNSGSVSVLLGNANGSFQTATNITVGSQPTGVAVGRFNGDGFDDLAVSNYGGNSVSVLLGNGNGSFQPATSISSGGNGPYSVVSSDFDGDGRADLAVVDRDSNRVAVLRGNGDGSFQAAAPYAVGAVPHSLAVGDFNGDGRPDLVASNATSQTMSLLLGTGTGTFAPQSTFAGAGGPFGLAVGDFNGDGAPDVAFANNGSNNVSVLLSGAARFTAQVLYPLQMAPRGGVADDFNGDGKIDLAYANRNSASVSVLLGNGNGSFQNQVTTSTNAGTGPGELVAGNFNNDTRRDLAVAENGSSNVAILLGNGNGTFTLGTPKPVAAAGPSAIVAARFNADAFTDLATANLGAANASILLGAGDGSFTAAAGSPIAVGSNPAGIVADFFNGDAFLDLAIANSASNTMTILLGNGLGGFSVSPGSPVTTPPGGPIGITSGDFNRDGRVDLAVATVNNNLIGVFLGNGAGGFTPIVDPSSTYPYVVNSQPNSLASADVDGDGKLDLLVPSAGLNTMSLLLGNGDGTFQPQITYPMGSGSFGIVVADFNSDAAPDVAISNNQGDNLSVRLNTTRRYGSVFADGFE